MLKKIFISLSFPYLVGGTEAVSVILIFFVSSKNIAFDYVEATFYSVALFIIIEFIFAQKKLQMRLFYSKKEVNEIKDNTSGYSMKTPGYLSR